MSQQLTTPLRPISIRVPWHDNGWNGTVCNEPCLNTACLKLKRIAELKQDQYEGSIAGRSIRELLDKEVSVPPCIDERATFMADFDFFRQKKHPYVESNPETHGHFMPTSLRHPAYSAPGVPFFWMMKNEVFGDKKQNITGLVDRYPLEEVSQEHEPDLKFHTTWVQDHRNHRALLDCFWSHVRLEQSLVFIYAKQVPLVEDTGRRVLIGVGRVKRIGEATEYKYDGSPGDRLRSLLWERMVTHSIRPGFKDGFLLPYHEALDQCDDGAAFDPAEVVAFAPEERFTEFSYGTEHVGNDAAISALLAMRESLHHCSELFGHDSEPCEQWIDRELGRLWTKRGAFPGLGAVLAATGVELGNFVAKAIVDEAGEEENPWPVWYRAIDDPTAVLPRELARRIGSTTAKAWRRMPEGRRAFLELLSRMDLTQEQAEILAGPEAREAWGIGLSDDQIRENPYLVYEATRLLTDSVSIGVVDRGMFATAKIRDRFPLPSPSLVETAVDARRLRALTIRTLEVAASNGDTLRQRSDVIRDLLEHSEEGEKHTQLVGDHLNVAEDELFEGEIRVVELADSKPAYQLERLSRVGQVIRNTVEKRVQGKRHDIDEDWRQALDKLLAKQGTPEPDDPDREEAGRCEKTAALAELAAARFSVLIGGAGTGKTTLLSVLCTTERIAKAGVLLLAPTGKARVRMEDVARRAGVRNYEACTVAQHLSRTDRYNGPTQRYLLTGERGEKVAGTVIVDECSMLTEEMLAAIFESLSGVDRMILVGDSRQLPPIGAGRPFADIVARLKPIEFAAGEPRVGSGYAELTIPRRQGASERDDLLLASWFGGEENGAGDDRVFEILTGQRESNTVQFVSWETPDELEANLAELIRSEVLQKHLDSESTTDEWVAFGLSLGGSLWNRSVWFNSRYGDRPGSGVAAEEWQILSPGRQKPWGVDALNRRIHTRYKARQLDQARRPGRYRSIPSPKGDQQIIYGDKVINNRNTW